MRAVLVTVTNETEGYMIDSEIFALDGSTDWGDDSATLGDIFRQAQHDGAGRCRSRVYKHLCTPAAEHNGYFFVSRQPCDTDDGRTYLRGMWVLVANAKRRRSRHMPASAVSLALRGRR